MSIDNRTIPQEILDGLLARMSTELPKSEQMPLFSVHRVLCHKARVMDLPAGASTSVTVHDMIRKSRAALGNLVSSRSVGPFVIRLVHGRESNYEFWRIIETDSRNKRVVILTYDSGGDRAREVSAQYAADATEIDLASDFDPGAHFFGESRTTQRS